MANRNRVLVRGKPDRKTLQLYYVCPFTGKDKTKSAGTDSPREAERRAAEWEAELNARHVGNDDPSWDVFRLRFEEQYLDPKPYNTQLAYVSALNRWEEIIGSLKKLSLITPSVVSDFATKLGKLVAQTTVAKHLRHLRAAFRWAESMEMLGRAPRIVMPKLGKRRLARGRSITEAEYQLMLAAVPTVAPKVTTTWTRFLELLWLSGLRINEALILSWDEPPIQVDLDAGRYPRLIVHEDGQKSRQDEICVIPGDFADWLKQTPPNERFGLVVDVQASREDASRMVSSIGKAADVRTGKTKFASAHDLRRAFGQRWARKVKPLTLQKMMRHATLQTTLAYYVDIDESDVGQELWPGR